MPRTPSKRANVKVCVFGSGTFGTALGSVMARNGFTVTILCRCEEVASSINTQHKNPSHLSECKLPPLLSATTCPQEALKGVAFIVHSVPVQASEDFLKPLKDLIPADVPFISTSKGIHSETLETMAELVPRVLQRPQVMAFLSGPTFAKELMDEIPSAAVVAAEDPAVAESCSDLFHCTVFKTYTTTDVIGVEVGGALKNVYALAAGTLEGMGLGFNTAAFLVTRACVEMNMLALAMGAQPHTMVGLAGIGDLMLTCLGGASRNKAVGARIGQGESLASVLQSRQQSLAGVAEGVATAPAALRLARRHKVPVPIIDAVASVIDGVAGPREALLSLMQRPKGEDFAAHVLHGAEKQLVRSVSPLGVPPKYWAFLAVGQAFLITALFIWFRRS
ncbi:Glycerol-3-phosphate dehydrogenase [NAD(+)] 2 [Durusdinium trenchii]|uniref:Glycerol-3-phosphate dehydrogenase [NAD(+)] n=1 Tax=Durusdinium trenchii TaxID=1381693 RepID=A0ABP0L8G4_9DINO